jgi:hypothetical protein
MREDGALAGTLGTPERFPGVPVYTKINRLFSAIFRTAEHRNTRNTGVMSA